MINLAQWVVIAIAAIWLEAALFPQGARSAPVSAGDLPAAEAEVSLFSKPNPRIRAKLTTPGLANGAASLAGAIPWLTDDSDVAAAGGWFDAGELEFTAAGAKAKIHSDPDPCASPDNYLRTLAGGEDKCSGLRPSAPEPEGLAVPLWALLGWVVAICLVAGLYQLYGYWRVQRWVRHARAQGLIPNTAKLGRRDPSTGSRLRRKSSSRRYAG